VNRVADCANGALLAIAIIWKTIGNGCAARAAMFYRETMHKVSVLVCSALRVHGTAGAGLSGRAVALISVFTMALGAVLRSLTGLPGLSVSPGQLALPHLVLTSLCSSLLTRGK